MWYSERSCIGIGGSPWYQKSRLENRLPPRIRGPKWRRGWSERPPLPHGGHVSSLHCRNGTPIRDTRSFFESWAVLSRDVIIVYTHILYIKSGKKIGENIPPADFPTPEKRKGAQRYDEQRQAHLLYSYSYSCRLFTLFLSHVSLVERLSVVSELRMGRGMAIAHLFHCT